MKKQKQNQSQEESESEEDFSLLCFQRSVVSLRADRFCAFPGKRTHTTAFMSWNKQKCVYVRVRVNMSQILAYCHLQRPAAWEHHEQSRAKLTVAKELGQQAEKRNKRQMNKSI